MDVVHLVDGTLRFRIEGADTFHFIIKQLNAKWVVVTHGKEIDDGAAYGKFAVFDDL